MKKTILLTFICVVAGSFMLRAQQSSKAAKDLIEDKAIVYPESMTENLAKLLSSWQIDFSKYKAECSRGQNVVFHDSIYTNRLHAMPTVMELSFNQIVKQHIEMYSNRRREQVSYMLSLGDYYFPIFEEMLDKYGLPLELKYLPVIESALNPIAVSHAGATGLWQFMLPTGKGYGLEVNSLVDERRDPYKSTEAAVRYLRDLYRIYGDWNLVIAAYNCGPGNVNKAIARSGGKRDYWEIYYHLPHETRGYVPAFIAANYIMNYYNDHNICPMESYGTLTALDTVHVNKLMHFEQIAQVLDISTSQLKRLNPQFKQDVIPGNYKPYALVLPTNKMLAFIDQQDSISNHRKTTYFAGRANTDRYLTNSVSSSYSAGGNSQNVYYRVKRGDNLSNIARKNGTSVNQLKSWNRLRSNKIAVGRRLIVKKKAVAQPSNNTALLAQTNAKSSASYKTKNKYHKVRKGDTLGSLARRNGVSVFQLKSWNGLRSNTIPVGKSLVVKKVNVAIAPPPPPTESKTQYNKAESSQSESSNVISDYLKSQIEKVEKENNAEEQKTAQSEEMLLDEK